MPLYSLLSEHPQLVWLWQASDYRHSFLPLSPIPCLGVPHRRSFSFLRWVHLVWCSWASSLFVRYRFQNKGVLSWKMMSPPSHQAFNIEITAGHLYWMMIQSKSVMFALISPMKSTQILSEELWKLLRSTVRRWMSMEKPFWTIWIFGYYSAFPQCVCFPSPAFYLFIKILYYKDSSWDWLYMYVSNLSTIFIGIIIHFLT